MSKRKIDHTITEARIARAKRSKKTVETKVENAKPAERKPREKAPKKEDLVVFAFRLTSEEREAIHKAAGPAKASRFVRSLAVAAARNDTTEINVILKGVSTKAE